MPEKPEWKMSGQMLTFTLPLPESVANLKSKIQEEISMPPAKQKLFFDVSFLELLPLVPPNNIFIFFRVCSLKIQILWHTTI